MYIAPPCAATPFRKELLVIIKVTLKLTNINEPLNYVLVNDVVRSVIESS
jgi:hypothetical protein